VKRVTVVSGLFVNDEGKILLALRNNNGKAFPNTWEIPGGKVEDDEVERAALIREVREELGVKCYVGPLISVCSFRWERGLLINMLLFECIAPQGSFRNLQSQALAWASLDEVSHGSEYLPCPPSMYSWYPDIAEHLDSGVWGVSVSEIENNK
jgi:8-oxo-dGTP diphosphatase